METMETMETGGARENTEAKDGIAVTPELLADLKKKAQKATPGPWEQKALTAAPNCFMSRVMKDGNTVAIVKTEPMEMHRVIGWGSRKNIRERDAAYIAAANPQVMLALIARLEELEANNYGLEILNDPAALTTSYVAGARPEGRENNAELDRLKDENETLQKFLACKLVDELIMNQASNQASNPEDKLKNDPDRQCGQAGPDQEISGLKKEIARLEELAAYWRRDYEALAYSADRMAREADWLAEAQNFDVDQEDPSRCPPGHVPPESCKHSCKSCWREAAREKVKTDLHDLHE